MHVARRRILALQRLMSSGFHLVVWLATDLVHLPTFFIYLFLFLFFQFLFFFSFPKEHCIYIFYTFFCNIVPLYLIYFCGKPFIILLFTHTEYQQIFTCHKIILCLLAPGHWWSQPQSLSKYLCVHSLRLLQPIWRWLWKTSLSAWSVWVRVGVSRLEERPKFEAT